MLLRFGLNPAYSPTRLPLSIFAGHRPCLLTKQTLGVEFAELPALIEQTTTLCAYLI